MNHGSLFSGIGGFDLAAEWMGWQNVFHCEWNPFGQRLLKYYWPNAISYHDITKTDFTVQRGSIDILTGGFPCQPYSTAGKRLGKADERHLWPEMLRAIREIRPRWVVGENVLGLVSWNGGLVFEEVQANLEAEGYEVQSYVLPAAGIGAPHRRDRIFFIAHARTSRDTRNPREISRAAAQTHGGREESSPTSGEQVQLPDESSALFGDASNTPSNGCTYGRERTTREEREGERGGMQQPSGMGSEWDASNADSIRLEYGKERGEVGNRPEEIRGTRSQPTNAIKTNGEIRHASDTNGIGRRENERKRNRKSNVIDKNDTATNWETFPTVSPLCDGNDGISDRLDGITFSKWRNESIKGGGNAVVPQVVLQIFKAIEEYESKHTS